MFDKNSTYYDLVNNTSFIYANVDTYSREKINKYKIIYKHKKLISLGHKFNKKDDTSVIDGLNSVLNNINLGIKVCYELYDGVKLYYFPSQKKGPYALICPGGGFSKIATVWEGFPIANELQQKGITSFVLQYRIKDKGKFDNVVEDVASAIRYIEDNLDIFNVEKNYSLWGYSAGGYLAGIFATENFGYKKFNLQKPTAVILSYPVVSMNRYVHAESRYNLFPNNVEASIFSLEENIDSNYPKTFLWHCRKDKLVDYHNSIMLQEALNKKSIDNEVYIYDEGMHGLGLAKGYEAEEYLENAIKFIRRR
ncbi:alpha/beta hydrolase [Clostridium sp. MSJ-8]|uniref:alpha/beta hydrolase n=1 Tax=Clostridium sp. MSJ-8 TaxID=2841510 RepID=UPI001C0EDC74|nr:alpha/beta hydrolase [Clostridium sp. MSJ-8]